jgi:uroporphyrinogen decarboxylase
MTKREVVQAVIAGRKPPYVPWNFGFTYEARQKLREHFGFRGPDGAELGQALGNHILGLGNGIGFFDDIGNDHVRDVFGVVWDRSVDKDIGMVVGTVLPEPTVRGLRGYKFPNPTDDRFFNDIPDRVSRFGDRYRIFDLGFSLYERAWTLRGMENLMLDFIENPGFVHDLLRTIADYNIAQCQRAVTYDIDAVHFGDDWGQQHGLQMGPDTWRQFILPELRRMYAVVRAAGKAVSIHSCGDVDEVFPELIEAGCQCFNPFQPEVMDVAALMKQYRGRLAFYGGLSTQKTLPYGTVADVKAECQRLLELGRPGGYIFAPAHAVEGDVPLENMMAFIEEVPKQAGAPRN